ncbi:M15 family metallopeptidase [Mangrovicoccus ximenensis]|uniref:M15 family metallopeptidase n=1 Tax=Mangrovicoccus ximenensis TaxID=1911570 RepID=UPI000D3A6F14|nr:M15 family metallopeptidase [Mangrovicoccus ximenensis]
MTSDDRPPGAIATRDAIASGRLTALAATEARLARIAEAEPGIRAWVEVDAEGALLVDAAQPEPFPVESRGQQELVAFYGLAGRQGGYRPPLVQVPVPWVMRLAWDSSATRSFLWIHEKAAESAARALGRIAASYTGAEIRDLGLDIFGGDYAPRKMRGADRYSLHSWGIAIDFDPVRNALRADKRTARLAQPDAEPFWRAWEAEGWTSLGRDRNYDWMHVQAAARGY